MPRPPFKVCCECDRPSFCEKRKRCPRRKIDWRSQYRGEDKYRRKENVFSTAPVITTARQREIEARRLDALAIALCNPTARKIDRLTAATVDNFSVEMRTALKARYEKLTAGRAKRPAANSRRSSPGREARG